MISTFEEECILQYAYIPEHIPGIMCLLSKGEPFLKNEYVFYKMDNWLIFVGYPLTNNFDLEDFEKALLDVINRFKPEYTYFIAPEVSSSLIKKCEKRESDYYYKIDINGMNIKKGLLRIVEKASKKLIIEVEKKATQEHTELIEDFIERERPSTMIERLFLSIPEYVQRSDTAILLNSRDKKGRLTAFYLIDLKAKRFATYLVGCHSKKNYIPHSSDLLFFEMINLARKYGKDYINLGLGVNYGIRRFKEKWGAVAFLKYEFCVLSSSSIYNTLMEFIKILGKKL